VLGLCCQYLHDVVLCPIADRGKELALREHARARARSTLPGRAATVRALTLAICEAEAGLWSTSQLSRSATRASGRRSPTASSGPEGHQSASPRILRIQVQEPQRGLGLGGGPTSELAVRMPASVGHPGASAHAEYRTGWADARDGSAANQLARRLAEYGRIDELRTEVGAGAPTAGSQLLDLLTALGQPSSRATTAVD
jgi:hypothetical protein